MSNFAVEKRIEMYSLKFKVTTSTCDSEGRLKLFSALQMMQDCSELWIDSEPVVKDFFAREGMTQLLVSRQVEIVRVPRFGEDLTVTTSVYGMKPMFGFRNTFIYDADGRPCYKTWSMGAFVDREAGRLKRVDQPTMDSLTIEPQLPMTYGDRRIILPHDGGEEREAVVLRRNDIDYNRHVNNAHYVRIAFELLPEEFVVGGLRVEYRVAAKEHDVLTPVVYPSANAFTVVLMKDGEAAAIVEFTR